jgi:hypothetical protein
MAAPGTAIDSTARRTAARRAACSSSLRAGARTFKTGSGETGPGSCPETGVAPMLTPRPIAAD